MSKENGDPSVPEHEHGPGDDDDEDDDDDLDDDNAPAIPWSKAVDSYCEFFDRPVVLQLRHSVVGVDDSGESIEIECHPGSGKMVQLGIPYVPMENGQLAAMPVVAGKLGPSECGDKLILTIRRASGALIEMSIEPPDVAHVWVVTKPAPKIEESLIVKPTSSRN